MGKGGEVGNNDKESGGGGGVRRARGEDGSASRRGKH